jgi:hypothetical protein
MWPFKKKSAEHALRELVDGLSRGLGDKLSSVMLYGSKASGEFREGRSDVNVFVLTDNASQDTFDRMAGPLRLWRKAGHPMPVLVPKNELQAYANNLPIEFLDMQDHHKVIFGSDPLQGLSVSRLHLRSQCAQELSIKLLKLRQAVLLAGADEKRLRIILIDSLPSILTLFRAVLRLEGDVPKGNKLMAAQALAQRLDFEDDCLERLADLHLRRDTDNVRDLAQNYVQTIARVLGHVSAA